MYQFHRRFLCLWWRCSIRKERIYCKNEFTLDFKWHGRSQKATTLKDVKGKEVKLSTFDYTEETFKEAFGFVSKGGKSWITRWSIILRKMIVKFTKAQYSMATTIISTTAGRDLSICHDSEVLAKYSYFKEWLWLQERYWVWFAL